MTEMTKMVETRETGKNFYYVIGTRYLVLGKKSFTLNRKMDRIGKNRTRFRYFIDVFNTLSHSFPFKRRDRINIIDIVAYIYAHTHIGREFTNFSLARPVKKCINMYKDVCVFVYKCDLLHKTWGKLFESGANGDNPFRN